MTALIDENLENEISLDYEVAGIHDILKNCSAFNVPMAGVYIDGELKAFTVGSLNERENMASTLEYWYAFTTSASLPYRSK